MARENISSKRVAKNTMFLYFRMALVMIVGIYTSRVKLQYLGIENVGIYNVVGSLVLLFTFLKGSMTGATQRFLTFAIGEENEEKMKDVFSTSLNMHILLALLILLLGESIGLWFVNYKLVIPENRLFAANIVYQFSLFSTIVSILSVPYNAAIVSHEKMGIYAYISIASVIMNLLIIFTLPYVTYDILATYALLVMIVTVLVQLVYMFYCKRNFDEIVYRFKIKKELFHEMFGFMGWLTIGNFSFMLNNQGVNVLLNLFFGPAVNAARGLAVQVQGAVKQFVSGYMTAVQPQLVKTYASGEIGSMHKLLIISSKFSFILMSFLSLPVFLSTSFILNIWLVEVPEFTEEFLNIILLQAVFESLSLPLIMSINATGKIRKFQMFESSLLLIVLPIGYVGLKLGGNATLVYWVCFIVEAAALFLRLGLVLPKIDMKYGFYLRNVIYRLFPVYILSFIVAYIVQLKFYGGWIEFIVSSSIACISITLFSYLLGLDKSEKQNVLVLIRSKMLKR